MADEHYIGETFQLGAILEQDISSITTKTYMIQYPDETTFTVTGANVVIDDSATGEVHIICDPDEWNQAGIYVFHVYILFADTTEFFSKAQPHEVKALYT